MVKPFLVPDDLDGHRLGRLVVEALHHLTKGALPYHLLDLIAVGYVVVHHFDIATVFVVVACVKCVCVCVCVCACVCACMKCN